MELVEISETPKLENPTETTYYNPEEARKQLHQSIQKLQNSFLNITIEIWV